MAMPTNDELQAMIMEYLHFHSLHDTALALQQEWLARQQLIKSNGGQPIAPPPKPLTQKDKERMNALIVNDHTYTHTHTPQPFFSLFVSPDHPVCCVVCCVVCVSFERMIYCISLIRVIRRHS